MSDSFEDWNDFRRGENPAPIKLTCCECGGPAQGNVDTRRTPNGPWLPLCDACNAADQGGEAEREKMEDYLAYKYPLNASDAVRVLTTVVGDRS